MFSNFWYSLFVYPSTVWYWNPPIFWEKVTQWYTLSPNPSNLRVLTSGPWMILTWYVISRDGREYCPQTQTCCSYLTPQCLPYLISSAAKTLQVLAQAFELNTKIPGTLCGPCMSADCCLSNVLSIVSRAFDFSTPFSIKRRMHMMIASGAVPGDAISQSLLRKHQLQSKLKQFTFSLETFSNNAVLY